MLTRLVLRASDLIMTVSTPLVEASATVLSRTGSATTANLDIGVVPGQSRLRYHAVSAHLLALEGVQLQHHRSRKPMQVQSGSNHPLSAAFRLALASQHISYLAHSNLESLLT